MRNPESMLPKILLLALVLAVAGPAVADTEAQPLFRIERSKNTKLVQYDARVRDDGNLDPDDPVDAYWRRASGTRKELKWLQRRAAYGFSVHWDEDRAALELEMKAPIGRRVRIARVGSSWQAQTRIDGRPCRIDRIYVKSIERRFRLPKVEYIDFGGTDLETGEPRTERYAPD